MHLLRVMIVEDEPLLVALLGELLAAMGHDVCAVAATEQGARTAAARSRPDLILMDARLGAGSGVAAMAAITRARPVPHIFVTGAALSDAGLAPGAIMLRKPFSEHLLAQAIMRAVAAAPAPSP